MAFKAAQESEAKSKTIEELREQLKGANEASLEMAERLQAAQEELECLKAAAAKNNAMNILDLFDFSASPSIVPAAKGAAQKPTPRSSADSDRIRRENKGP